MSLEAKMSEEMNWLDLDDSRVEISSKLAGPSTINGRFSLPLP